MSTPDPYSTPQGYQAPMPQASAYPPPGAPAAYPMAYGAQGYPAAASAGTNPLAIIALVCALIGLSIPAVIVGHIGLSKIKTTGQQGRGLAIAGLVLGYLGIVVGFIVLLGVFLPLLSSSTNGY